MADIGIRVQAKDEASAPIAKVGKTATRSFRNAESAAKKAKDTFALFAVTVTAVNSAIELGKKAFDLYRRVVLDSVDAALEFRKRNDPIIKQFAEMKKSAKLLRAAIGDVFITVIQAVSSAFDKTGESIEDWIRANRKLIASKIVEFLTDVVLVLAKGIIPAVILVNKAFDLWRVVMLTVKKTFGELVGFFVDKAAVVLGALGAIAEATGQDGIAGQLRGAQAAVTALRDEFVDGALAAVGALSEIEAAQEAVRKKGEDLLAGLTRFSDGLVASQDLIRASIGGTNLSLAEQEKIAAELSALRKKRNEADAAGNALLAKMFEKEAAALHAATLERIAELDRRREESAQLQAELIARVGDIFADVTDQIISNLFDQEATAEETAKAIAKSLITAVVAIIAAEAARGAAGAFAGAVEQLGPFAGPAVGAAIGAVVAAAIIALGAGLTASFQHGGFVTGGIPNRDSVSIMAEPGEFVMSRRDVAGFRQFATAVLGAGSGQALAQVGARGTTPRSQAGDLTQNTTIINRTWFPSRVDEMRMSRRQSLAVTRLKEFNLVPG